MLRRFISVASKFLKILAFVVLPLSLLIWVILQAYSFTWTGFSGKTLWDWMELFIIPIVLGIGAFFLNRSERESDRQRAEERAKVEREIATDRQRESALQTYIDRMADLLLNEKLRTTKNKEIRDVARTRTLSVLRGLDGNRKSLLFRFLVEAQLIGIKKPVIELQGANLSDADLKEASLIGANLSGADLRNSILLFANLSGADLSGVDLRDANVWHANLNGANLKQANLKQADLLFALLRGADLSRADLRSANLNGADLSDANLYDANLGDADLSSANLKQANLRDANLSDADLGHADLSRAKVTNEQLEKAKSLKNAILPDGTNHD